MILVEIRPRGGTAQTIAVHPGVTVIGGLDGAARRTWADDLARALRGQTAASLDLIVEIDGSRQELTPELAVQLGLDDQAAAVTVFAVDLPGAKPAGEGVSSVMSATPADAAIPDLAALEGASVEADERVRRLRAQVAEAERAATAASDELLAAGRHVDREARTDAEAAEAQLEAARAAAASATQQLRAGEAAAAVERAASDEEEERSAQAKRQVELLQSELGELESRRAEIVLRMFDIGDPGDTRPVEAALAGLRRLRSVKPKPSPKAIDLADRWHAVMAQLAALPQPPQPPEWLVTPALAALHEAREALAEAISGGEVEAVDPAKVEALEQAHREVLEAEQRAMKKGSRLNRRRLDAAHHAEQGALAALGVKSYGEYLQRLSPALEGDSSGEARVISAQASLADAEAVWEELHGGQASPEWTAVKEQQAVIRTEALAHLGRDVEDQSLEDELRSKLETVVDTAWAEQELATALHDAGALDRPDEEVEATAARWLTEAPALLEARRGLESELHELDGRLAGVEQRLAEQQANVFFGDDTPASEAPGSSPAASGMAGGSLAALGQAAREAEAAEAAAEAALRAARARQEEDQASPSRRQELEEAADACRAEVDRLREELASAEAAALRTRTAGAPSVDLSGVVGMEAEAYLLARVASLRSVTGGGLPLVLDGDAVVGLSDGAARRVFRLLGRLGGSMQVVVIGDDEKIATWADGLGDQAAVRQAAAR